MLLRRCHEVAEEALVCLINVDVVLSSGLELGSGVKTRNIEDKHKSYPRQVGVDQNARNATKFTGAFRGLAVKPLVYFVSQELPFNAANL